MKRISPLVPRPKDAPPTRPKDAPSRPTDGQLRLKDGHHPGNMHQFYMFMHLRFFSGLIKIIVFIDFGFNLVYD